MVTPSPDNYKDLLFVKQKKEKPGRIPKDCKQIKEKDRFPK